MVIKPNADMVDSKEKFYYKGKRIAVIVPAYNEEQLISQTISTIPDYINKIIVVDDNSQDKTTMIVESFQNLFLDRLVLIRHGKNKGVGAAIETGYKKSLELDIDIAVVMAGDAQMDPEQLPKLLDPIIENKADYTKGNRLISVEIHKMPKTRQKGNALLTMLTKVASGYWEIMDPQNGYTAASKTVLQFLVKQKIYPRYGYCNDIIVKLNIYNFRIQDVIMPPVYGDEKSKIKLRSYTPKLSWLLIKLFFYRINKKYGGINFHPLLLFYYMGMFLFTVGMLFSIFLIYNRLIFDEYSVGTVILTALFLIIGVQLLLFALLFDALSTKYQRNGKKIITKRKPFLNRLVNDYWGVNFHPLVLFFISSIILLIPGFCLGTYVLILRMLGGSYSSGTLMLIVLLIVTGVQFLLFSLIYDEEVYRNNNC